MSFVKPIGKNNEHPGYSDEVTGQQHVAELVAAVQKSNIWRDCVIIITYDENGGRWDHVAPPVRTDRWGVGVRVPGIIISPFVRRGAIDSTEYETVSILKLIENRFNLAPLACRDKDPAVNDLAKSVALRHRLRTSAPFGLASDQLDAKYRQGVLRSHARPRTIVYPK